MRQVLHGHAAPVELTIRSSTPLLSGDSGGPLVNSKGQLVGINARSNITVPCPRDLEARSQGIPVGAVDDAEAVAFPASVVPDSATVVSELGGSPRGPLRAARAQAPHRRRAGPTQVLLAHDGQAVHRDGGRTPPSRPRRHEAILGTLDCGPARRRGQLVPPAGPGPPRRPAPRSTRWCSPRSPGTGRSTGSTPCSTG